MEKILFIDRDGTIIHEPPVNCQVDSLEKLSFLPRVILSLKQLIDHNQFTLVMVTNQDGLGTDSFPDHNFWPAHNKMLEILKNEGVEFSAIHIDRSFEWEGKETRKPGIGMLTRYMGAGYDLKNSYVIGDRRTDVELAKNLGCKAIYMGMGRLDADLNSSNWNEIAQYLSFLPRKASIKRITKETDIQLELNLDGKGDTNISTGLGFFDHMLHQLGKHSGTDITLKASGDLNIDEHHTIEDTALAIGETYLKAIGDKKGINRYGFLLPMDDSLVQVAIDLGGRPWLVWGCEYKREKIGDMPTEMFYHFFKSFSDAAKCNLNIKAEGNNEHHKIEATFKAVAKSIRMAVKRNLDEIGLLPSTKGVL